MNGPEVQGLENSERDPRMQEFEQALSRAMQRVEVPAEMTAKFMAVAEEKHAHAGSGLKLIKFSKSWRVFAMPQARVWMGGAIAAVLAMGIFVGGHMHTEHERRVQAQQQFEAAERITDQALERTREQLRSQGIYLDRE
jgi:hypothetical protein